jgi:Holliday junction resolvasome RuvABC DNA-binding subunit
MVCETCDFRESQSKIPRIIAERTLSNIVFAREGFTTARERELFLQLISVNGV